GHDIYEVEKAMTAATAHPKTKTIGLAIIVVLALLILLGMWFIFEQTRGYGGEKIEKFEKSDLTEPQTEEPAGPTVCTDKDCAQESFKQCRATKGSYSLFFGSVVVEYEILGPKGEFCEVRSIFTKNPQSSWVGKEMTCLYDPDTPIEDAIQDMSRCEGPLADTILS
ncbi:MAG: hypothetical protein ACE5FT_05465, partial [Candidatus Nanoarchaeia archaeon]